VSLPMFWFIVIAVLWCGFFVLEGFDFGVGALHRFVGGSETGAREAINAIGPFWDGNEVWLIVGGAGIFAAFPGWYATWFSAGYLALLLVLVALIIRGVSFEFRGKVDTARWRATWSWTLTVGSVLAPLLLGVAVGDLLAGLPIDSSQEYTGTFWNLLTGYGLALGLTVLVLCLLDGATFLTVKTLGPLRDRAATYATVLRWPALVLVVVAAVWTYSLSHQRVLSTVFSAVAVLGVAAAAWLVGQRREGQGFAGAAVGIGATVAATFAALYPNVMVSSTSTANNLTVANTASSDYALKVMTVVALIFFPIVLLYQGWTYVVFRRRVGGAPAAADPATPDPDPEPSRT
jgi:cytochrome bd ubiquinol oxidase subunit II